jgi:hypothetical protein
MLTELNSKFVINVNAVLWIEARGSYIEVKYSNSSSTIIDWVTEEEAKECFAKFKEHLTNTGQLK